MKMYGTLFALLLSLTGALPAQEIQSHPVVTLAGPDGVGFPWEAYTVTRMADGRWVAGTKSDLHIFSPGGSYLRDIGGEGQGPGEWLRIDYVARRGDSLAVFDSGNGRMTILGPDLEVVRTFPLSAIVAEVKTLGNGFVLTGRVGGDEAPDMFGRSLFFLDSEGDVQLATRERDFTPLKGTMQMRSLLSEDGRSVWTLSLNAPELEEYSSAGQLLRTMNLGRPDWWQTSMLDKDFVKYTPEQMPPSINAGVRVQGGRLWTITNTPVKNWKHAFGDAIKGEGGVEYYEFEPTKLFRTAVELRSVKDGRLIARRFLDGMTYPSELSGDGYRVRMRTNDVGLTFIDVERITYEQ